MNALAIPIWSVPDLLLGLPLFLMDRVLQILQQRQENKNQILMISPHSLFAKTMKDDQKIIPR